MSEKYHYESGAIHHDHHKEINIGSVSSESLGSLLKAFFKEDAEEAEIVEEVKAEKTVVEEKTEAPKQPKVEPELPPADRFVNRVKAIVREAAKKNGQKIATNTRAWEGEYVFFVDGARIANMMDDLRKNHEGKIADFLADYSKCDGVTVVAPFVGKVLDIEELSSKDLQKSDLDFAFIPYYNNGTSAVKRMSDKLDSEAANVLLGTFKGLLRKYPRTESA